jgi:uncharacterized damage-inducible protein DinB
MYAFSRFLVPVRFILMQMFHAMAVRWPLSGPPGYRFRDTIVWIAGSGETPGTAGLRQFAQIAPTFMEPTDFRRLFKYDYWANQAASGALKSADLTSGHALALLAHIVGTQYEWCARIKEEASPLAIWPELTIAQCEQHADALRGIWQEFINTLDPSNVVATVVYKNSKGQSFTNSVADILLHVLMHSTYHRGQIATEMRALGHTPAYTDFIVAARFNLLS